MDAPRHENEPLLEGLTDAQRAAVTTTEGPLLVLAAAGSGKTRVITRRIAYLIHLGVPPWQILALTFTNKAAAEMRERIHHILSGDQRATRGLTVTTFHALCARLLRRYADRVGGGLDATFTIYDSADQLALMKSVVKDAGLATQNFPPRAVLGAISNAKNQLLSAAQFGAQAHDFYSRTVAKLYEGYEKALRRANAADFDDLLMLTARLLSADPEARSEIRARWQYLLIDEYQDTNHAQFVIASAIADRDEPDERPNVCVVGDPDQAIYGWRGADIANILEFEERYPDARVITLGENFRSHSPILRAADTLIRVNQLRKHKDLYTSREGGERPTVVLCRDERHEAELVCDWLRRAREEGGGRLAWKDMAVFYRTNALSRVMEDALRTGGVPYVIARGTAFYEREEIKDALAYLRVLANPADDVSLARIVNKPTRGLGATSMSRIAEAAQRMGEPLMEGLRHAGEIEGVSDRAAKSSAKFIELIDSWTGGGSFMGAEVSESLADLVDRVVKESGLEKLHAASGKSDAPDEERTANLAELVSSAAEFEGAYDPAADAALDADPLAPPALLAMLRAWLESVALVADADRVDPSQGAVTLMTLHAAKGLEFPAVAMIGLEQGVLPHSRASDSAAELEEERRLCFVGITRAMERLLITSARYRTIRGVRERAAPSQFLGEIGEDNAVFSDQTDDWDDIDDVPTIRAHAGGARDAFRSGDMVRHPTFGVGAIEESLGPGKVRIRFRSGAVKTLILEHARLVKL